MSEHVRRELIWSQGKRYRNGFRPEKTRILSEFCEETGMKRKYAISLLNRPSVAGQRIRERSLARLRFCV